MLRQLTILSLFSFFNHAAYGQNFCDEGDPLFNICEMNQSPARDFLIQKLQPEMTCIATAALLEKAGTQVPKCPETSDPLQMLDNTHPTGGIFVSHITNNGNSGMIRELAQSLKASPGSKLNIIVQVRELEKFYEQYNSQEDLKAIIHHPDVNIIPVQANQGARMWVQDSIQFSTLDQKPHLIQLQQYEEQKSVIPWAENKRNSDLSAAKKEGGAGVESVPDLSVYIRRELGNRLGCQIARRCKTPIYQTPNEASIASTGLDNENFRAGGNLEALPGGRPLMGGEAHKNGINLDYVQKDFHDYLQAKTGKKPFRIDVSFLSVGHVDEIVNFVKISEEERIRRGLPPQCNFLTLMASPEKAFENILEQTNKANGKLYEELTDAEKEQIQKELAEQAGLYVPPEEVAQYMEHLKKACKMKIQCKEVVVNPLIFMGMTEYLENITTCSDLSDSKLTIRLSSNKNEIPDDLVYKRIQELGCFGLSGFKPENIIQQEYYLKNNIGKKVIRGASGKLEFIEDPEEIGFSHQTKLNKTKKRLLEQLKADTGCETPPVLDVPVIFSGGSNSALALIPDAVNGIVQTNQGDKGSHFIAPKMYEPHFEQQLRSDLADYGISLSEVQALDYHVKEGQVHCATSAALVCTETTR